MFVMIIIAQNGACNPRLNSIGELNSGLSSVWGCAANCAQAIWLTDTCGPLRWKSA